MLALFGELGPDHIKRRASKTHQAIVEGVRSRNVSQAERGIIDDIQATSDTYRKHLEKLRARDQRSSDGSR
jgi:DNA-binding GntR family transcriptional regulator